MRRLMVALTVMGTALIVASGVALAATIACPNRDGGRCVGTAGDDTMLGRAQADDMSGRTGNDTMSGRGGPDVMVGDIGADNINGGPGNDRLEGGSGADILNGRKGDDRIFAARDRDSDSITCGPGQDFARVSPVDVIENQAVGGITESVLETTTSCEDVDIVLLQ
jgi:Ca2+-binding RTX toxin-like protein